MSFVDRLRLFVEKQAFVEKFYRPAILNRASTMQVIELEEF
tara:strand:- start:1582 stop:1704 length:123 start_codon:yes stop_codon:yes gene_type:complete